MIKKQFLLLSYFICYNTFSQIVNEAPYILTINELKNWTQTGSTADPILIAKEDLAPRFINNDSQLNPNLSNDLKIAYLPDGMNNFANYGEEQNKFNLYNFTHWSYIDSLIWFGGSADQTVQLPSAPWTNAAHKNGVKVFGNIFFAPTTFGGSTNSLLNFLEKDSVGNFLVIPILVDIIQYYNFDGWFVNQETRTNRSTALLMHEFLGDLTEEIETLGKEIIWYDAMLLNGNVGWQNRLNSNNDSFVQDDADGNSSNGFEKRISSGIFINFSWPSSYPSSSNSRANIIGRSEFDVFTGVDLWPNRNQQNFESGGNSWMGNIHRNSNTAYTSLGLFAPNCVFNNSRYSNFNTDPNDYEAFYSQERHMFDGADRNPRITDNSGFKGYSNWVPAASTISNIPFETNFNTGHGFKKFKEGVEISNNQWHNLNGQDILPTWQFAFSETSLKGKWDFSRAYNSGSSLNISGNLSFNTPVDLLLYKTKLLLNPLSKIDIIYKYERTQDSQLELLLSFSDSPSQTVAIDVSPNNTTEWISLTSSLSAFQGRELATIGLRFSTLQSINNYSINIGNLRVHENEPLSTKDTIFNLENSIVVTYPNQSKTINIYNNLPKNHELNFTLYNLQGQELSKYRIDNGTRLYSLSTRGLSQGIYIITFKTLQGVLTKKIIVR